MAQSDAEKLAKENATKKAEEHDRSAKILAPTGEGYFKAASPKPAEKKDQPQPTFVHHKRPETNPALTTYDDMVGEYQTAIVRTSSGKTFEIESVGPGEYMMIFGSPLAQALTNMGFDPHDPQGSAQKLADTSVEDKINVLVGHNFQEFAEKIVCAGVISLNLARKAQNECDKEKKELSVSRLAFADLCELFNAIIRLSVSGEEIGLMEFFREGSEEVSRERDSSPPDSERIPHPSIGATVSEETGS